MHCQSNASSLTDQLQVFICHMRKACHRIDFDSSIFPSSVHGPEHPTTII